MNNTLFGRLGVFKVIPIRKEKTSKIRKSN